MKNARRNVDGLSRLHGRLFGSQAHLASAFHDEVDFFLLLVVPRHLAAIGLKYYMTQRKISRLNRACTPNQVLSSSSRWICSAWNLR